MAQVSERLHAQSAKQKKKEEHTLAIQGEGEEWRIRCFSVIPVCIICVRRFAMAFAQSVLQRMLREAPSDEHFDVRLIVDASNGEQETVIRAHRIVLCTVSDVFQTMFSSGMREHVEGVVRITDFTPQAVREAIDVIYGGELSAAVNDWQLAGQIWDFGFRFRIDHVTQLARKCSLDQVCEENCLRVLGFAIHVGDDDATEQLQAFIAEKAHFLAVVSSPEFQLVSYEVISSIRRPGAGEYVEADILTFEKVWFDALMAWAGRTTSGADTSPDKDKIENALKLVDFTRMKTHELREAFKNEVALESPLLANLLVAILLARAEKLESINYEKNRDLEELGAAYQVALFGKNEAERNARLAIERLEKATANKMALERRTEQHNQQLQQQQRRRPNNGGASGSHLQSPKRPSSIYNNRRRYSNPTGSPLL